MKRLITFPIALAAMLSISLLMSDTASAQTRRTNAANGTRSFFVDQNGDGLCDNSGTRQGGGSAKGKRTGAQDGTGAKGSGVRSGNGTGLCDGGGSAAARGRR